MELLYLKTLISFNVLGLALLGFIFYYGYVFKSYKIQPVLAIQILIIAIVCVLEIITYAFFGIGQGYDHISMPLRSVNCLLQCYIMDLCIVHILQKSQYNQTIRTPRFRRLFIFQLFIQYIIVWFFTGMKNPFSRTTIISEYGRSLCFILLYVNIALVLVFCIAVMGLTFQKDQVLFTVSLLVLSACALSIVIDFIQSLLLDSVWWSSGLPFAFGFSIVNSIISTKMLIDTSAQKARIKQEMNLAASIQLDALPKDIPAFPSHPHINLGAYISPFREIGGDFYDYFELGNDKVAFLIADVSGKGIPAALFMMKSKKIIKIISGSSSDAGEILTKANQILSQSNEMMMFVTLWLGILDTRTLVLNYSNGGHNPPVWLRKNGEPSFLRNVHGLVLGPMEGIVYGSDNIELSKGDRLFLYTDGLTEAHNKSNELFGEDRAFDCLCGLTDIPPLETLGKIRNSVDRFANGREQFDDITMMCIDIN